MKHNRKRGTVDNSLVHHFLLIILISTPPSATHVYIVVNGRALMCCSVTSKPSTFQWVPVHSGKDSTDKSMDKSGSDI